MAIYRNTVICKNGKKLLAKAIAGLAQIKFTSIKTSDTEYGETQLENLESIGLVKQTGTISSSVKESTNSVSLYTSFINTGLSEGYTVRNFGIYATDPEGGGEVLYAIVNADESTTPATFIPAYGNKGTSGVDFSCEVVVSNADEVTVVIDGNAGVPLSLFDAVKTELTEKAEEATKNAKKAVEQVTTVSSNLDKFKGAKITDEQGVHGLRYHEEKLQIQNHEGAWVDAHAGGGGISPSNCKNISVQAGNGKLKILWEDPENTVVSGQTLCRWAGTKLVVKEGSYPENVNDGTLLVDNKVRNQYKAGTSGYLHSNLQNGRKYYFMLFPYSDQKAITVDPANRITGTPQAYVTYGIEIDLSNSNPNNWAKYIDDAVGMVAGSDAFDAKSIFDIQSYTFLNGKEVKALSKTNNRQYADGGNAQNDLTSGVYDIMTKFKRGGYQIKKVGNKLQIRVTDDPNKEGFCYKAFQRGGVDKQEFYLGRYKASEISSKLRSVSGKTPVASKTIGQFRTLAQANGAGYEQSGYYQLVWRQCLYMVKYLAKNSQDVIGKGYVGGSNPVNTGGTDGRGDKYGSTSTTTQMILFGLEDFWGNVFEWIDGLVTDGNRDLLLATNNFNDTGSGYSKVTTGVGSNVGGYCSDVLGDNDGAFCIKASNGSSTTYFCDYSYLGAGCLPIFGGNCSGGDSAGVCCLYVNYSPSSSYSNFGGRLMFLAPN